MNFSVLNGIRISAYQPSSTMRVRTSQMPSQFTLLSRPSLAICASHLAPAGLVANSKPLRLSANVSTTIRNASPAAVLKSFFRSLTTSAPGSLSWAKTPM